MCKKCSQNCIKYQWNHKASNEIFIKCVFAILNTEIKKSKNAFSEEEK